MPEGFVDARITVEQELVKYVGMRRRYGDVHLTFEHALLAHRRQCFENLLADEDEPTWVPRIQELDAICQRKGIALVDEPTLSQVRATIANRDAKRQRDARDRDREIAAKASRAVSE